MSSLILRRANGLAFPGGNPGFDRSHPIAAGCFFSGVCSSTGFVNLLTGLTAVVSGTLAAIIDPIMGPAGPGDPSSNRAVYKFYTNDIPVATQSAALTFTYGHIFRVEELVSPAAIMSWGGSLDQGGTYTRVEATGQLKIMYANGGQVLTTFAKPVAVGVPYFWVASQKSGTGILNVLLMDLHTGFIQTQVLTAISTTSGLDGTASISIGDQGQSGRALRGSVAACMASNQFSSMQQLLAWARDPWSFWYPQKFDVIEAVKAASGGATFTLPITLGNYTIAGSSSSLNSGRTIAIDKGIYTLTGKTMSNAIALTLIPAKGLYNLLGAFIGLIYTPLAPTVGGASYQKAYKKALQKLKEVKTEVQNSAAILAKSGGHARAAVLTPKQRSSIASSAARARWK